MCRRTTLPQASNRRRFTNKDRIRQSRQPILEPLSHLRDEAIVSESIREMVPGADHPQGLLHAPIFDLSLHLSLNAHGWGCRSKKARCICCRQQGIVPFLSHRSSPSA